MSLPGSMGMEGISNARDLGGYPVGDGRIVKYGCLLRTGRLNNATPKDIDRLVEHYGVKRIIDMRTSDEVLGTPDPEIPGAIHTNVRIIDENDEVGIATMTAQYAKASTFEGLIELSRNPAMTDDVYKNILYSEYTQKAFRLFFDEILAAEGGAVLFHCSGGKDRTGMGSILLLTALGADRKTCIEDFGLTNLYIKDKIDASLDTIRANTDDERIINLVRSMIGVEPSFMERMFDASEEEYGSVFGFIKERIGLTDAEIEYLREVYTVESD